MAGRRTVVFVGELEPMESEVETLIEEALILAEQMQKDGVISGEPIVDVS
jgi:hypothetical protein